MNRVQLAGRRARATANLKAALERLQARFELPKELGAPFIPGNAPSDARQLLETEHLVAVIDQLVTAPVRSASETKERLKGAPEIATGPTPEEQVLYNEEMRRANTPPAVEPALVAMGFPDNAGPPVLHGPGMVQRDAMGREVTYLPEAASAQQTALAAAESEKQDVLSEEAVEMAQQRQELETGEPMGHHDNAGPPVDMAPGRTHTDALGRRSTVPLNEDPQHGMAAAAEVQNAYTDQLAIEKQGAEQPEGRPAGFADNPGPEAQRFSNNVNLPNLDQIAEEQSALADEQTAYTDELAAEKLKAGKSTLRGGTVDLEEVEMPMAASADAVEIPIGTDQTAGMGVRPHETSQTEAMEEAAAQARADAEKAQLGTVKVSPSLKKLTIHQAQKQALSSAGYGTPGKLRKATDEELLAVQGIGPSTLETIRAFAPVDGEGEDEDGE